MTSELRPELQVEWLGHMQREMGVNASNLLLKDIIIADQERRIVTDASIIAALRTQLTEAEADAIALRAQVAALQAQASTAPTKPSRSRRT